MSKEHLGLSWEEYQHSVHGGWLCFGDRCVSLNVKKKINIVQGQQDGLFVKKRPCQKITGYRNSFLDDMNLASLWCSSHNTFNMNFGLFNVQSQSEYTVNPLYLASIIFSVFIP